MANKQNRQQLYEWFETGDRPTQLQFEDLIDSIINQKDDDVWVDDEELYNGQTNPYEKFIGIGNRQPVAKLSVSGGLVVGGNWANNRLTVPLPIQPENGMLVEGSVRIGTLGDGTGDNYRLEVKNQKSDFSNQIGSRPLRINSDNHDMIVFSDDDPANTGNTAIPPYTFLDEGKFGFRFYSWAGAGNEHEALRITPTAQVGIERPTPTAKLDVNAGSERALKLETSNNDAITFAGTGNPNPHTLVDESNRGFRFYDQTNGRDNLRISPTGDITVGSTAGGTLTINGTQGNQTGLRLPNGAVNNAILAADAAGNTDWRVLGASFNDGDWLFNGNSIYNNTHNVGINTANPATKLDVNGIVSARGGIQGHATTSHFTVNAGNDSRSPYVEMWGNTNGSTPGRMTFVSGEEPDINQNNSGFLFTGSNALGWPTLLRIEPHGNVGVGVSNPGVKLDVNGIVRSKTGGIQFPDNTIQTTAATNTRIGTNVWASPLSDSSNRYHTHTFEHHLIGFGFTTPPKAICSITNHTLAIANVNTGSTNISHNELASHMKHRQITLDWEVLPLPGNGDYKVRGTVKCNSHGGITPDTGDKFMYFGFVHVALMAVGAGTSEGIVNSAYP